MVETEDTREEVARNRKVDANDIAGGGSFFRQQLERVPVATVSPRPSSLRPPICGRGSAGASFWLVRKVRHERGRRVE